MSDPDDEPSVEDLLADLDDLAADAETPDARAEIRETRDLLVAAGERGLVESDVRRLDPGDAVEALVGSVVFTSPLLVEGGVFEIADHLVSARVAGVPVYLAANAAFVVVMTYALLEWTGRDRVEDRHLFGLVSARVVMILVVSFVVSAVLMTVWGRVGGWHRPMVAVARVSVLWTVGSLGAALGDILSGDDTTSSALG